MSVHLVVPILFYIRSMLFTVYVTHHWLILNWFDAMTVMVCLKNSRMVRSWAWTENLLLRKQEWYHWAIKLKTKDTVNRHSLLVKLWKSAINTFKNHFGNCGTWTRVHKTDLFSVQCLDHYTSWSGCCQSLISRTGIPLFHAWDAN